MPHDISLITTIAASLGLALVLGFVASLLRIPPLVGYLVAGIIVSPATPGFVADVQLAGQLAEIGVMLMMFGVGLHFSIEDLLAVRRIALPGALLQITVATLLAMFAAWSWGWSTGAALVFGLCLSVASTVVLLRALESRGLLKSMNGQIAVGWLVVEDLVTVLVLVVLPALAPMLRGEAVAANGGFEGLWRAIFTTVSGVTVFIALMLVVGRRVFPRVLWHIARLGSRELFTLAVISAAVGVAYAASELFNVSFALGAFFAGMMMRESPLSHRAADESLPLREAFSVLFFVSVGMLVDPDILVERPGQLAAVLAIVLLGKTLAAIALVLMFRYPLNTALTVGVSLAQIGEFSFILAALGRDLELLPFEGQSLILAASLISISLNPFMFGAVEPLQKWIRARSSLARALERPEDPLAELPATVDPASLTGHVLIVGYGRVGRRIADALLARGVPIVVIERNREQVERLREKGIHAVSGDAEDAGVLIQGHVARARVLVLAVPDASRTRRMVEVARTLNPNIDILIRTHSDEEAAMLRHEQLGTVYMGEQELATAMIDHIQRRYRPVGQEAGARAEA